MAAPVVSVEVHLINKTIKPLSLFDQKDWYGSGNPPVVVPSLKTQSFTHSVDTSVGFSIGGVAYVISGNIKWIVAWSNEGGGKKVYVEFTTGSAIDWDNIYVQLKKANKTAQASKPGFESTLEIDQNGAQLKLNAKIEEV